MLVALLLYAYAIGEHSSRGIERRCVEDIAFRVITANQAPDHAPRPACARSTTPVWGPLLGRAGSPPSRVGPPEEWDDSMRAPSDIAGGGASANDRKVVWAIPVPGAERDEVAGALAVHRDTRYDRPDANGLDGL